MTAIEFFRRHRDEITSVRARLDEQISDIDAAIATLEQAAGAQAAPERVKPEIPKEVRGRICFSNGHMIARWASHSTDWYLMYYGTPINGARHIGEGEYLRNIFDSPTHARDVLFAAGLI